jgi:hypothetical protein
MAIPGTLAPGRGGLVRPCRSFPRRGKSENRVSSFPFIAACRNGPELLPPRSETVEESRG